MYPRNSGEDKKKSILYYTYGDTPWPAGTCGADQGPRSRGTPEKGREAISMSVYIRGDVRFKIIQKWVTEVGDSKSCKDELVQIQN